MLEVCCILLSFIPMVLTLTLSLCLGVDCDRIDPLCLYGRSITGFEGFETMEGPR